MEEERNRYIYEIHDTITNKLQHNTSSNDIETGMRLRLTDTYIIETGIYLSYNSGVVSNVTVEQVLWLLEPGGVSTALQLFSSKLKQPLVAV